MKDLTLVIMIVLVALAIIGVVLLMKKEHYTSLKCPSGFNASLNGYACVLPGERVLPCETQQVYVDSVCRYPLPPNFQAPSGWSKNFSGTGIRQTTTQEQALLKAEAEYIANFNY